MLNAFLVGFLQIDSKKDYSNRMQFDYCFAKIPPKMHLESMVAQR